MLFRKRRQKSFSHKNFKVPESFWVMYTDGTTVKALEQFLWENFSDQYVKSFSHKNFKVPGSFWVTYTD
jgi:hypothetical protein